MIALAPEGKSRQFPRREQPDGFIFPVLLADRSAVARHRPTAADQVQGTKKSPASNRDHHISRGASDQLQTHLIFGESEAKIRHQLNLSDYILFFYNSVYPRLLDLRFAAGIDFFTNCKVFRLMRRERSTWDKIAQESVCRSLPNNTKPAVSYRYCGLSKLLRP